MRNEPVIPSTPNRRIRRLFGQRTGGRIDAVITAVALGKASRARPISFERFVLSTIRKIDRSDWEIAALHLAEVPAAGPRIRLHADRSRRSDRWGARGLPIAGESECPNLGSDHSIIGCDDPIAGADCAAVAGCGD
jgi:hypothetical protein